MRAAKVAVTIDAELLREVDRRVAAGEFPNRSRAVRAALLALLEQRDRRSRLLGELAKLDPQEEQALANEALAPETPWPTY